MKIFESTNNPIIRGAAGAGKTDCVGVLSKCNAVSRFLYLSFGKENTVGVKKRFGANVESKTFHAFARQYLIDNGALINTNIKSKIKTSDIIAVAKKAGYHIDNEIAFHVIAMVDFICKNPVPTSYCTHYFNASNGGGDLNIDKRQMAVDTFKYYWKYAFSDLSMPITHDMYLKLLSFCKNISAPYDVIVMDEFQDATAIMNVIATIFVDNSAYKTIRLGDPMQCVFMYQGAVGHKILQHPNIQLNQSRRCGVNITKVANALVEKSIGHGNLEPMLPASHADHVEVSSLKQHAKTSDEKGAYLARYNATILKAMITLNKMGIKFSIPNSLSTGYIGKIYELIALQKNDRRCTLKKLYRNMKDFKNHAAVIDDKETLLLIGIVEAYGNNTDALKADLTNIEKNQTSKEQARYLLGTIHQAKGATYNTVIVAPDVSGLDDIKEEEVYVNYTAITRASKKLILPEKLKGLID